MVNLIEQFSELGITTILISVLVVISLLMNLVTFKNKMFEVLDLKSGKALRWNELTQKVNDLENNVEKINKKYNDIIEKQEVYHEQSVKIRNQLSEQFNKFDTKFDKFVKSQNEKTVASFRSTLWSLHKGFIEQGFVTPDGLKTFFELGEIYENAGGNDIYHEKLKPEVEALEIRHPDGGVYK